MLVGGTQDTACFVKVFFWGVRHCYIGVSLSLLLPSSVSEFLSPVVSPVWGIPSLPCHTHATQRYLSFAEGCSRKSLSLIVRPLTASPSYLYPNFANGAWGLPDLHEHPTQRSGTRAHAACFTHAVLTMTLPFGLPLARSMLP